MELVSFLLGTLASLGFKEENTGEQCSIGSRHLLACQDDPTIYIGTLPALPISTALRATGIVVDSFQKINVLMTERVFVFVEVNNHIADLGALVAHCIIGGTFQVADLWVALKQTDDADGKLSLSRTFLAIDV